MKNYIKSCIIVILAIIGAVGLNFVVVRDWSFLEMFFGKSGLPTIYGSSILYQNYSGLTTTGLLEFFALYYFIKNNSNIDNKRLKKFAFGFSIILSVFTICGSAIMLYSSLKIILDYLIIYFIKFISLLIVYYNFVFDIFNKLTKYEKKEIEEKSFFTGNLKSFFIVLFILLLAWLPYFLQHFPGAVTYDTNAEINQILGNEKLTNYNPIVHVGFLALSLWIGNLFGSISAGVVVNMIAQFLIVGIICSFTIYYLAKKKVDVRIRISCLLFFALFPAIPIMNVIIQKDTIFSAFMILKMIVFYEILTNAKSLFQSKLRIIFSVLILVITALARRNALYVLYASVIVFSIYVFIKREIYKNYVVKILSLLFVSAILSFSINKIVANQIKTPDSWKKFIPAKYNVMIQQLLRTTIDHKNELSEYELSLITELYADSEEPSLEYCYKPFLTDSAMKQADSVFFKNHKDELISLYFKLMFRYPMSYINTILCTTSGYWDIEESRYSLWTTMYPNNFGIDTTPIYESYIVSFIERLIVYQNIPLIGLLFSTALPFWILLGIGFFNLYYKKYNLIVFMVPIFLYYATVFLGPLNGEIRYIFCLWMCMPLLITLTFHNMGTNK